MSSIEKIVEDIVVVSITKNNEFAQKFLEFLGKKGNIEDYMDPNVFSGGEFYPEFTEGLEGKNVYIVAAPSPDITPQDWKTRIECSVGK